MSHSYRQSPIVGRHRTNRIVKNITNRFIRHLPIDTEELGSHNVYRRHSGGKDMGREVKWYVPATARSYHVSMKVNHIPKADVIRQAESYQKLLHNNRRDRQKIRQAKELFLVV